MDANISKEPRSSADYSHDSFDAEHALLDGTLVHKPHAGGLKKLWQLYGVFSLLQLLLLAFYTGIFFTMRENAICPSTVNQSLVYCKLSIPRTLTYVLINLTSAC